MESTLPNAPAATIKSTMLQPLRDLCAFLMVGGASILLMFLLAWLRSPQMLMQDISRNFFQEGRGMVFVCTLMFSYPHFMWTYRFAYQQGTAFIRKHLLQLLICPAILLGILTVSAATSHSPVSALPFIAALDAHLQPFGVSTGLSRYQNVGQLILASLLAAQILVSGQHFCFQAYGIALAFAQDKNYKLTDLQRRILRMNLYALWAMNIVSGFTFLTALNGGNFAYHPMQLPQPVYWLSYLAFAVSLLAVLIKIVLANAVQDKVMPPLLSVVTIVSLWLWLQPFCQPYGFQAWAVPIAHGAQYLYFSWRVEDNNFDAHLSSHQSLKLLLLSFAALLFGYLSFVYLPVMLDRSVFITPDTPNFFLLAAFVFLSLHHYAIDTTLWKRDSRARQALHQRI